MKIFVLTWRDPNGNLNSEEFDAEQFKVHTEPGWLKLHSKEHGAIVRLIPSDKVCLVQYGQKREPSPILKPTDVLDKLPNKFQES